MLQTSSSSATTYYKPESQRSWDYIEFGIHIGDVFDRKNPRSQFLVQILYLMNLVENIDVALVV